jgi:threonine dehydrogenase-like Zn-dependent dehydrogenase
VRQLVFVEPGKLEWQDAPDPQPGPGQAIVRPLAVSRCDLDVAMTAFGLFPGPYPVGHEIAAEVLAVGAGVDRVQPGQRVAVPFQVSCGTCRPCVERHYAACEPNQARAGADMLVVPDAEHLLVAAPDAISDVALATIPDNVIDAYRTVVDGLRERPGAEVLIVGGDAPSISLYTILCARALGAGRIRYADSDPDRLAAASDLGAEITDLSGEFPAPAGPGADRDRRVAGCRGAALRDPLNQGLRPTVGGDDSLRATDPAAAVGDVHPGNHLPHLTR